MNKKLIFNLECLELKVNEHEWKKWGDVIRLLIENEVPFKIKNLNILKINFEKENLFKNEEKENDFFSNDKNSNTPTENLIKRLLTITNEHVIKVSASMDNTFSGNAINHSQLEMTLDEYFNYQGEIQLYLSQLNLLRNRENNFLTSLKEIIDFQPLEQNLNIKFNKINIWHSYNTTLSKFHYDSYENLLYVIKGVKNVFLAKNNSKLIKASSIGENSGNQCERIKFKRSNEKIQILKNKMYTLMKEFSRKENEINENLVSNYTDFLKTVLKYFIINTQVKLDEVLYIPEGMWHQVETIGNNNLAFNFWWDKTNKLIENDKEFFLIKQSMASLVEKKIKKIYFKHQKEYFKYKIKYLKRLIEDKKEKLLLKLLFKPAQKDDSLHWVIIYSEFEKQKNSNLIFFENFWSILDKSNNVSLFMEQINGMKKRIFDNLLDKFKDNI